MTGEQANQLSDLPLDIVGEILDNLQDDLAALDAAAQSACCGVFIQSALESSV